MDKIIIAKEINGAPVEFQIFPYGKVDIEGDQAAVLDDESMSLIINSFNRRGNEMVVDYEHQTLKNDKAPAAGWIKKLVNRGKQGLWAVVDWTVTATDFLKNREYRYFSPVFNVRKSDKKIINLFNVALTNSPMLNNLQPIIAKLNFNGKIDPATLEIAKLMGNTETDLICYGGFNQYPEDQENTTLKEATLKVAEMMGNTEADIILYNKGVI